jgi:hypothetical protein
MPDRRGFLAALLVAPFVRPAAPASPPLFVQSALRPPVEPIFENRGLDIPPEYVRIKEMWRSNPDGTTTYRRMYGPYVFEETQDGPPRPLYVPKATPCD